MAKELSRQELREVIEAALPDPLVYLVEKPDHAENFYRRQAIRVEAAITSARQETPVSERSQGQLSSRKDSP